VIGAKKTAKDVRVESHAWRSLASLSQRELIEPTDGGYRFQVKLIRRWFAQKRQG
jgi:hypothetical protein